MSALTPLRIETLKKIEAGQVAQVNGGYGAWRIAGGSSSSVGSLIRMKLVKLAGGYLGGPYVLTDAGRAALKAADGAPSETREVG